MRGTGLAIDEPTDRGPGHADIGSEAGASLKTVAADVDHDRLNPVMEPWSGKLISFRKSLFLRSRRMPRFGGVGCNKCGVKSLRVGHSLRVLRRVSEAILPNKYRTCQ